MSEHDQAKQVGDIISAGLTLAELLDGPTISVEEKAAVDRFHELAGNFFTTPFVIHSTPADGPNIYQEAFEKGAAAR